MVGLLHGNWTQPGDMAKRDGRHNSSARQMHAPTPSPHYVHVVSVKARYSSDTFCRAAILALKDLLTDPKWHVPVVQWTVSKFSNAPQIYFKYSSYNV